MFSKTSKVTISTDDCSTVDIKTNKPSNSTPFGREKILDIVKLSEKVSDDTYIVLTSTPTESGTKFFTNDPHIYEVYEDRQNNLLDYIERKQNGTASGLAASVIERFALKIYFYRTFGVFE